MSLSYTVVLSSSSSQPGSAFCPAAAGAAADATADEAGEADETTEDPRDPEPAELEPGADVPKPGVDVPSARPIGGCGGNVIRVAAAPGCVVAQESSPRLDVFSFRGAGASSGGTPGCVSPTRSSSLDGFGMGRDAGAPGGRRGRCEGGGGGTLRLLLGLEAGRFAGTTTPPESALPDVPNAGPALPDGARPPEEVPPAAVLFEPLDAPLPEPPLPEPPLPEPLLPEPLLPEPLLPGTGGKPSGNAMPMSVFFVSRIGFPSGV
ncbi:MAG TPA: hypothetical protein VG963_03375 [Polyangiaceae bacterium]|nr:hypothetical protein [Polyangiaceae bacterium]